MAAVLTTGSTVLCGEEAPKLHGGKVAVMSTAKLTVKGQPVLVAASVAGLPVAGCKTAPPPPGSKPCTTVSQVLSGEAIKLKAGGNSVLLEMLVGLTDGVPPGPLKATAGQSKLTAQ